MLEKKHNLERRKWLIEENVWSECQDCGYRARDEVKKHPNCPVETKDIVVTLKKHPEYDDVYEYLGAKQGVIGSPEDMGYWHTTLRRINLTKKSRLFVVTENKITGFFTVEDIVWDSFEGWLINFNNWFYIDPISMSGFQGIKYFKKKFTIKEEND